MDLQHHLQTLLQSDYTIERELGGGGMSRVFLATEHKLGRRVVIKLLSSELSATLSTERFAREIQLAASLQQANIVPVLTAGTADGMPYFTMPFVEGESLRARLARGPMSETEAVTVLRDVTRALIYAHERGIVHRDIKPDNILLSGESAVVTDFGIAKAISAARGGSGDVADSSTITQVGTSLGTPAYIAPEQAAGDPGTDHRADLYALGCVAFELLTGQPPFHGRELHQLLRAHMTEVAPTVRSRVATVSQALDALVAQCLAKTPDERPANAREVLRQLERATGAASNAHAPRARSLPVVIATWGGASAAAWVLARAAVVGIGLPSWTVPLVLGVAALGLPAMLFTWYVQRAASRASRTAQQTPGGTVVSNSVPHGTMATMALRASPYVSWRRTHMAGIAAAAAVVLALGVVLGLRQFGIGPAASLLAGGQVQADSRILVAEFAATTSDSSLGSVLAQAMRTSLSQSNAVQLVAASDVAGALRRMTLPPNTHLTDAVARDLAQRNGIPLVITGQITTVGSGFLITTNIVRSDSGTVLATLQRGAKGADDLLAAVDNVARDVRSRLGESLKSVAQSPALADVTTASLPALRAYTLGLQAGDVEGDFVRGVANLKEAVQLDSTFAMAWRKITAYAGNIGRPQSEVFLAMSMAYRNRERLQGNERLEVEASYQRSISTKQGLVAYQNAPGTSQNNQAVALRDLGRYAESDSVLAAEQARDSAAGKPPIVQLATNRVLAQIGLQGLPAARRLQLEMQRRFPGAYFTEVALASIDWAEGGVDSLSSTAERMRRSKVVLSRATGANMTAAAVGARGQLRLFADRLTTARAVQDSASGNGDPLRYALFGVVPTTVHRRTEAAGVATLDSLRTRFPQSGRPAVDRQDLELAIAYAQLGRADKAKPMITEWARSATGPERLVRWAAWRAALGEVALAEGRTAEALQEFRAAADADSGALEPATNGQTDARMARAFDKAGQPDSALARFERVARVRNLQGYLRAPLNLPIAYRRLGELYEARGNTPKALENYRAFTKLWANADAELQPQRREVQQRIAQLVAADARKR